MTGATWNLSGHGVKSANSLQFSFYISCNLRNRRFPVKVPYLSERKVKFFMKRVREDSIELHTGQLWVVSWCLCHPALCVRCELPAWNGCVGCLCDVWRCVVGTAALPHLPKLQWCYRLQEEIIFFQRSWTWSKRHLWDATCLSAQGFMSWDLKDSRTGDVCPLLCSKVCLRSWGGGPTQQVYLGAQICSGRFWEIVLCSSKMFLDIMSHFCFRMPEERCKCMAKSWSRSLAH